MLVVQVEVEVQPMRQHVTTNRVLNEYDGPNTAMVKTPKECGSLNGLFKFYLGRISQHQMNGTRRCA